MFFNVDGCGMGGVGGELLEGSNGVWRWGSETAGDFSVSAPRSSHAPGADRRRRASIAKCVSLGRFRAASLRRARSLSVSSWIGHREMPGEQLRAGETAMLEGIIDLPSYSIFARPH